MVETALVLLFVLLLVMLIMSIAAIVIALSTSNKVESLRAELAQLKEKIRWREQKKETDAIPLPPDKSTEVVRPAAPESRSSSPIPPPIPAAPPPVPQPSQGQKVARLLEAHREAADQAKPAPTGGRVGGFFSRAAAKEGGWENFLGKKVLNKLGVVILVLGVIFLIGYYVHTSGKISKLAAGAASGGGLIGLGICLGRKEAYRGFVQPLIGGGWAILYFTAYAAHHIEAVKVIDNQMIAIGLLMAVAAGMILHSLKYRSQILTTFAYLLAYAAVWINDVAFDSLIAVIPLAISLVVLQMRMKWEVLPLIGQLLSYGLYIFWMGHHGVEIGTPGEPGEHFTWSLVILGALWFLFQFPLYFRGVVEKSRYGGQVTNALASTALFALQWHRVHPGSLYLVLFIFAAVHTLHAILQQRRGNLLLYRSYIVAVSVLVLLALGHKLHGTDLAWGWLIEAEALFLLALWQREPAFKHLAFLVLICSIIDTAAAAEGQITIFGRSTTAALPLLAVYAAVGYIHAALPSLIRRDGAISAPDKGYGTAHGWLGALFLALTIWFGLDVTVISVGWGLAAVVLAETALARRSGNLLLQGMLLAAVAAVYLPLVDFGNAAIAGGIPLRATAFLIVGFYVWYLYFRLDGQTQVAGLFSDDDLRAVFPVFSWMGMGLFVWLLHLELDLLTRPGGLISLALAALLIGHREDKLAVRIQAMVVGGAALIGAGAVAFLPPEEEILAGGGRWYSMAAVIAAFWVMSFISKSGFGSRLPADSEPEISQRFRTVSAHIYGFCAAGLLGLLFWVEFSKYYLTVAWAAEGFVLVLLGILLRQSPMRYPGLSILALCVGKIAVVDLSALEMPFRIISFIGLGIVLIAASYLYIRFSRKLERILPVKGETP